MKELDYFNKKYERGGSFSDYLSSFPLISAQDDPITGKCLRELNGEHIIRTEASPNYIVQPFVPERVFKLLPDVRILVMLRDPIQRLVSAYNMKWQEKFCGEFAWKEHDCYHRFVNETNTIDAVKEDWKQGLRELVLEELKVLEGCYKNRKSEKGIYNGTIVECLKMDLMDSIELWHQMEDHSHVYRSIYADQLYRWFKYFPKESFMFWSSEEFEKNPAEHMDKMVKWLGLNTTLSNSGLIQGKHHSRSYVAEIPLDLKLKLKKFFSLHNRRLFKMLEEKGFKREVELFVMHFE